MLKFLRRRTEEAEPSPREVFEAAAKRHPDWLEDAAAGLVSAARERAEQTVKEAERLRAVQIVDTVLQAPEPDREYFLQRAIHMEADEVKVECFDLIKRGLKIDPLNNGKPFGFADFAK